MKISRKNLFLLVAVVFVIVVIAVLLYLIDSRRERSFSEVTQNLSERVAFVKDKYGKIVVPERYEDTFLQSYIIWREDIGSTAHTPWKYYDKEGNLLFTFTFLGNRNLARITIGETTKTYQYKDKGETE